ncbi:MAG: methylated-DNA--[protein]-cysteine S-methyltransferase [Fimbriimonas sp.]|nr:methylated-DNA--[protein]-cysteine S-methyltransferase [Fimbriimonas sp.]
MPNETLPAVEYTLFETAIGPCGIAWQTGEAPVIHAFHLPEASEHATEERMTCLGAKAVAIPAPIEAVIAKARRHLARDLQDFRDAPIDWDRFEPFSRRVYQAALDIPPGQTRTYGQLAKSLGEPQAAQAVGQSLGSNPIPLIIPCHRILAADGKMGGFSAPGGLATKEKLLIIEGALSSLFDEF